MVLTPIGDASLADGAQQLFVRRTEVRRRAGHGVVAVARRRRTWLEVPRPLEVLTDQARADDDAVALHERAVRAPRERNLCDPRNDQWVDDPGQHGERQEGDDRRNELASHTIPSPPTTRSISLI